MCAKLLSHIPLFVTPSTVSLPDSPVSEIFQARILQGLPFLPPGDLPNLGMEPEFLVSPALASGFFTTSATWLWDGRKKFSLDGKIYISHYVRYMSKRIGNVRGWKDGKWEQRKRMTNVSQHGGGGVAFQGLDQQWWAAAALAPWERTQQSLTHREWAERRHQQPPALCPILHCAPFSLKHPGAPSKPWHLAYSLAGSGGVLCSLYRQNQP